jgi:hypothetical protein
MPGPTVTCHQSRAIKFTNHEQSKKSPNMAGFVDVASIIQQTRIQKTVLEIDGEADMGDAWAPSKVRGESNAGLRPESGSGLVSGHRLIC